MDLWKEISEKRALLDKAIDTLANNGYDLAAKDAKKIIDLEPKFENVLFYARCEAKQGNYKDALESFNFVIENKPNCYTISYLSDLIRIDSENTTWLLTRMILYVTEEKYDLAKADLELFKNTFSSEFYNEIKKTSYYEEIMKNTK